MTDHRQDASADGKIFAALVAHRRAADSAARQDGRSSTPAAKALAELSPDQGASDTATHAALRRAQAAARTEALDQLVEELRTLTVDIKPVSLDFDAVRSSALRNEFDPGGLDVPEAAPELVLPAAPPGLLSKVLPSSRDRHEESVRKAEEAHQAALQEHAAREDRRRMMLAEAMAAHERALTEAESGAASRNRSIDGLRSRIDAGEGQAIAAYFAAILAAADYPPGFPRRATVGFDASGRLLVVDYELPGLDAVPAVQAVRYDAATDEMEDIPRPSSRRKDLYAVVVASTALRSVQELFDADRTRSVDTVAFNGFVHGVDRATGEAVRPYLVSFKAGRDEFRMADVSRTDPIVLMHTLDAAFSTNPAELAPVRQRLGVRELSPGASMAASPDA